MHRITGFPTWGKILAALFVLTFVLNGCCLAAEMRAFWVDAWGTGFMSQAEVNTLLGVVGDPNSKGQVRDANCNAIVMQVRRNCDANYPSSMGEPYMSGLSPSNFNALQAVINAAHDTTGGKKRIEVHAWMVTFRTSGGHVYTEHDDTPTGSLTTLDNYWPSRDSAGAEVSDKAFDPGHPLAEDYTVNVAMDIVNNFDVDGIHFDYIRFTANNQGYNPTSLARYNARYGLSGQPDSNDPQWQQWRRDQVTAVVRKVYAKVQASKPHVKVSGSFVTWNPSPTSSTRSAFQGTRPYYDVYSDWDAWMQEGIVDAAFPMTYYNYASLPSDWTRWMNFEKDRKFNRHMYVGPGIYLNSLSNAILEIQQTRNTSPNGNNAQGWCGYSFRTPYSGGSWSGFSPSLVSQVTQTWDDIPTMPWKTSPTKAHISGTVTYFSNGKWADGATVSITGPENRSMYVDGTGFYAFIDLTPGTYVITAHKTGYTDAVRQVTIAVGSVTGNMYVNDLQLGGSAELIISNVASSGITTSGATITWSTSLAANSQVEYGLTTSYEGTTTLDPALVTTHSQAISGLAPATLYHYRVKSTAGSDTKYSGDYTFTTYGPPTITNVTATNLTNTTATITWSTNVPADSRVNYGATSAYGWSASDSSLVTSHSVTITDLAPSTLYHYQATSTNAYGTATSVDYTFTTPAPASETVIDNTDPGWTNTGNGTWTVAAVTGVPRIGANYAYASGDGSTTPSSSTHRCRWTPFLLADGVYDVYVYYQRGANRNTAAPFTVYYNGGQLTSIQNQYSSTPNQGGWFLIAENAPFLAGSAGYVEATTLSTDTKLVSADAAKWVFKGPIDTTPPTIDLGEPSITLTKTGSVTYTVTYGGADAVTLSNANVTLNKTGTANGTVAVSGSGTTSRTVTVSGITGTGTLSISIAAGTASDLAGNQAPAAGPSSTFTADNTAPLISSVTVTPEIAAAGDHIHIVVDTSDETGVASVVTEGSTQLTQAAENTWVGDIHAADGRALHDVTVVASDALGNSSTNTTAQYRTAQVIGALTDASWQPGMLGMSGMFIYKFCGKVTEINDDYFSLADASARPVTVHAPGYKSKVTDGSYASARGIVASAGSLESSAELIVAQ